MKKLFANVKKLPKSLKGLLVGLLVLAIPAVVIAGFGPSRPVFDYNKAPVNGSTCSDADADQYNICGSLTGPVFNSFVNTPSYGDERNFTRIAQVKSGQAPTEADFNETQTAQPGKEYWVRMLVHNDANQNLNGNNNDGKSVAKNTRVRVDIADGLANGVDVMGYVSASNSTPASVWDSSTLVNDNKKFRVNYVEKSAVLYNQVFPSGLAIENGTDSIVDSDGVLVGYDAMNGVVPGCFDFSAYVYVKVQVSAPEVQVDKLVRNSGSTEWKNQISAELNDTVDWRINYKNSGNEVANDVTIRDTLPAGTELVPGSIKWYDANHTGEVLQDTALGSGGVDLGNYAPAGDDISGVIAFSTKIVEKPSSCMLTNVAYGRAEGVDEVSDDAKVTIENCDEPQPSFSCTSLGVVKLSRTSFRFTASGQAQNTSITGYLFKVDGQTVQDSANNVFTLNQDTPGEYTVTVQVRTGEGITGVVANCRQTVEVKEEPSEPTYACTNLDVTFLGKRDFKFISTATAEGGATIKQYKYEFGDGTDLLTDKAMVEHAYAKVGTYTARVTVHFMVDNQVVTHTSENCVKTISIEKPVCPIPGFGHLPADSPDCVEPENCGIPGKEHLPKDSPECVLPDTGAGDMLGVFLLVSAFGTVAHNRYSTKRQ